VNISHSEFSGNVSRTNGGAIYSSGSANAIVNSTISGNLAVSGAAIFQQTSTDSSLELRHVTIFDNASTSSNTASVVNESGRLSLSGTIVIGKGTDKACSGSMVSGGYNFAGDNSCALDGQGDLSGGTALLGGLVPYGLAQGSTPQIAQAHLPAMGSPVLEKVPAERCPFLDQAYKNRSGVVCDIGAVQLKGTDVLVGAVKFSEPQFQVNELGGSTTIAVSRVDGNFGAIGVHFYDTEQGSAVPDSDYEVVKSRYLEWADGDSTDKLINITLYDDNGKEGTEYIEFALAGVRGGAAIGGLADTTSLAIIDDETSGPPAPMPTTVSEDNQTPVANNADPTNSGASGKPVGSTADLPVEPAADGNDNASGDQSEPANEPAPGTVITVGSARGGGGAFSALMLFILLSGVGFLKKQTVTR